MHFFDIKFGIAQFSNLFICVHLSSRLNMILLPGKNLPKKKTRNFETRFSDEIKIRFSRIFTRNFSAPLFHLTEPENTCTGISSLYTITEVRWASYHLNQPVIQVGK